MPFGAVDTTKPAVLNVVAHELATVQLEPTQQARAVCAGAVSLDRVSVTAELSAALGWVRRVVASPAPSKVTVVLANAPAEVLSTAVCPPIVLT